MFVPRIALGIALASIASMSMPALGQTAGTPQPSPLGSGVASPPSTPNYHSSSGDQTSKKHGHRRNSNQGGGTSSGGTGSQGS